MGKKLLASLLGVFFLVGFASAGRGRPLVILVPGAHFNGISFQGLQRELQNHGIDAITVDFKKEVPGEVTLKTYSDTLCKAIVQSTSEAIYLLGHSQGGAVINEALAICPDRVAGNIYLAATIPFPGEKAFDLLSAPDDEYYFRGVIESKDSGLFKVQDQGAFVEGFIPDGTELQKKRVTEMAHDEPIGPSKSTLSFDELIFRNLRKLVIQTKGDRIITFQTQRKYAKRLENAVVREIPTGHLPMITAPELVAALVEGFVR